MKGDHTQREPAARFLPADEDWRPQTWIHFRYVVLKKIHLAGAHTIPELCTNPPEVLYLPLNRAEIRAGLDSARRRGLVAPLHPGNGQMSNQDEWVLTDEGRRTIRHGLPWLMETLGGLPKSLSAFVALVGSLGLGKLVSDWFKTHDRDDVTLAVLAIVACIVVAGAILLMIRSRDTGAGKLKPVAYDWRRWAVQRPQWHRTVAAPFPWQWALGAVVYFFASTLAIGLIPAIEEYDFLSFLLFTPTWVLGAPVMTWYNRWDAIKAEAAEMKKAEAGDAAPATT